MPRGAFTFAAFPPDVGIDLVFDSSAESSARVERLDTGQSTELTVQLQRKAHLSIDVRLRKYAPDQSVGVVLWHSTRPRRVHTGIADFQSELRFRLGPGTWRLRTCSLYEGEVVSEVGPIQEIELLPGQWEQLDLEWPPEERAERGQ